MSDSGINRNPAQEVQLASGDRVSMQVMQQMYKEVTGKTEQLARRFSCSHRVSFEDLENLNNKIEHLLEQYNVTAKSCTVTFYHLNDSKARYSSFDRARIQEVSNTSPVENVRIEYEFLIILPKLSSPQTYKVSVEVRSRAAILKKMTENSAFQARLMAFLATDTGIVTVDYVDYAVARNMVDAVAEWFAGVPQQRRSRLLFLSQRFSHHFIWIFKYATATLVAYFFMRSFVISPVTNVGDVLTFGVLSFSAIYVLSGLASRAGTSLELVVDAAGARSFLDINRGDKQLIEECNRASSWVVAKGVASIGFAIVINIVGSLLANYIVR